MEKEFQMNRKSWIFVLTILALLLSSATAVALAQHRPSYADGVYAAVPLKDNPSDLIAPAQITATTYITVTSTADDYNDGYSTKCSDVPPDECTLRRAINQAYGLTGGERPVAIIFQIPLTDTGYNPTLNIWKIELSGTTAYDLRELYGQTILDGSTQPGGRPNDPKIIIDGLENHNNGLILRQGENTVRGLAMQNFLNAHIVLSSNDNTIEDCWFGLSDDGMFLSAGDETTPEGGSGVSFSAGVTDNTVRNNLFAGFYETAAAIRGDYNTFSGNWIGMRADGTVPIPGGFDQHPCMSGAWAGGVGITIQGIENQIGGPTEAEGNRFAGLFLDTTDQSPAMDISGSGEGSTIQNNVIGLDATDTVIGVCGRGLDMGNGPQNLQIIDNVIVETGLSAFFMNGSSLNGNTLQGNIIKRESSWPPEQGANPFPEDAIAYGPTVPDELRTFTPAQVLEVNGTTVTGAAGEGSPCPNCTIEVFLDDTDAITETLQSLDLVTADGNGDWTATLPAELEPGEGLRTMSTVPDSFTIPGLDPGTTSNLSVLYAEYLVFLPLIYK
jgi:CSLREA domain-containing protein